MKIEKTKHDHKLTHLLKVVIFAMLMLAPLFAAISQWCYATFNKNAKDSYYGETINESRNIYLGNNNPKGNTKYYLSMNDLLDNLTVTERTNTYITNFNIEQPGNIPQTTINAINENVDNIMLLQLNTNEPNIINIFTYNETNQNYNYLTVIYYNSNAVLSFNITSQKNALTQYCYSIEYNKYSYLSESFYYGVEQMTESPVFNWTQNTALYTGIKAMTDNLQVQTNVIAVLVTYWTILTIIYIIIDIVLALFTKLSHLILRSD